MEAADLCRVVFLRPHAGACERRPGPIPVHPQGPAPPSAHALLLPPTAASSWGPCSPEPLLGFAHLRLWGRVPAPGSQFVFSFPRRTPAPSFLDSISSREAVPRGAPISGLSRLPGGPFCFRPGSWVVPPAPPHPPRPHASLAFQPEMIPLTSSLTDLTPALTSGR